MFSRLSAVEAMNLKIPVDNLFILEYMPYAPDEYVKVYLYGLSLACHNLDADNSLDRIAKRLELDPDVVIAAFKYWHEAGTVRFDGQSVEYLPVRPVTEVVRKIPKGKYDAFTAQLNSMIRSRMISQAELARYYDLMENLHIEPQAMLAIISYSIRLHGEKVSYKYVSAVAKNLAFEGFTTFDEVHDALAEYDNYSADLAEILKALKTSRKPDHEDRRLYLKWVKTYGYGLNVVLTAARRIRSGGMAALDSRLTKYYELKLLTQKQIDDYIAENDRLYSLARALAKPLGVSPERYDYIVETYVAKWLALGYDAPTLKTIAEYCEKTRRRSFDEMNAVLSSYYKRGLITAADFAAYRACDKEIAAVLAKCGMERTVTDFDRDCYRTWTTDWKQSPSLIDAAAQLAAGKSNPISYMNKVLAGWRQKGVSTPEQAAAAGTEQTVVRRISADELNALFDDVNEDTI